LLFSSQEYQGLDVVVMTILRCSALLYTYHQFRNLHRIGSKYIVGIAGLFVVFSSFVFSCSVIKLLDSDVSDLNQIMNMLVILPGVSRLEQMCAFACLSILVNYIVFMTFFPACLSLVLELSNRCSSGQPPWQMATLARAMVEEEKPNPVVQRVKVIMSAGLLLVHGITRWSFSLAPNTITMMNEAASSNYSSDPHVIVRLLNAGLDHIVFTVILVALIVKYVLFESQGQLEENLIHDSLQRSQDVLENSGHFGKGFGPLGILRQRSRTRTVSFNSCREESAMAACKEDRGTQTEKDKVQGVLTEENNDADEDKPPRSLEECIAVINSEAGAKSLSNQEIVQMVEKKHLPSYKLESLLGNPLRAVGIRRTVVAPHTANQGSMDSLPYDHYDYTKNVIGYVPIPVGVAGPLLMNGKMYMVPMATTEGCLVASTNRGCRAMVNGVKSEVFRDGMTRAPSVRLPTAAQATEVYMWTRKKENFAVIKEGFDSTSRFARLQDLQVGIAGRLLFMRFVAQTGDAMGMNMVSKGTEAGLKALKKHFPELEVLSVSGNYCVDKKPSAINWIEGRGKSVVCESVVPGKVVTSILKTSVAAIVEASVTKNLVGSSLAGSIGGNNAHAANIIAAMFIACGQDPAQVVGSSNCMTLMEAWGEKGDDLHISVTMPSLEVGTVGGGTGLAPQSACLTMLGVKGAHKDNPGENACQLAKIVAATVLAGELSLMSALAAGHLVKSHLAHNRVKGGSSSLSSSTMPTTISSDTSGTSGITTTTPAPDGISSTKFCDVQPSGKASVGEVNSTNTCKPPAAVGDAKINAMQGDTVVSDKDSTSNIVLSPCQDPANISVPHSRDR
ncbi:3-hydroxy-3-methylglutaryl-coenzyme A reductase-like, partial [Homarus americanus]